MWIQENLDKIKERIERAAQRAGRNPREVTLVAVTKTVDVEVARQVYNAGIKTLGENRVQELQKKIPEMPADTQWHMIGHLQTNKVKYIIDKVTLLHSLDRVSLAEEISRRAIKQNLNLSALVQVNVSGEESKFGLPPGEVLDFIKTVSVLPGLTIRGLMTIAPYTTNPEEVRPFFRSLKKLAEKIQRDVAGVNMDYLSMGMTNDYEIAVEEGANIVRIGTAIFGARKY
ncbi:YggS family pyridoxal phosphate-dependent enzyme [Desulfolucanica intricata]|uniref:YggS family pyridoxal phosphate-dependent enzyme n=1 Tax=Desulfolucanica intricata TaxID=1285191 RepID=UPI00082D8FF1|nr:YggS family pyridoxal phosphate-dependent enzyme [Desulfolucanica intricata]